MDRDIGYYWVLYCKTPEVSYWNGDEWVLPGVALDSECLTDEDMKKIWEEEIPAPHTKRRKDGNWL